MKRVTSFLQVARARVVEMRVCAARNQSEPARKAMFCRMAAGEQAEALKVLAKIWEEHKDPTLLPEMAELHQGLGDCDEATRELDLAIRELQPIEILGTEFASPDAALAREALLRARTAKLEARCKPVRAPEPPATDTDESPVTVTQALVSPSARGAEALLQQQQAPGARKRWPLYVAIGGGVLAAGGVVSWGKMKQTESAIERHLKVAEGPRELRPT